MTLSGVCHLLSLGTLRKFRERYQGHSPESANFFDILALFENERESPYFLRIVSVEFAGERHYPPVLHS